MRSFHDDGPLGSASTAMWSSITRFCPGHQASPSLTRSYAPACRDMEVDDAIELGQRAIYHATFRDAVSGGTVSGEAKLRLT